MPFTMDESPFGIITPDVISRVCEIGTLNNAVSAKGSTSPF